MWSLHQKLIGLFYHIGSASLLGYQKPVRMTIFFYGYDMVKVFA